MRCTIKAGRYPKGKEHTEQKGAKNLLCVLRERSGCYMGMKGLNLDQTG